MDQVDRLVRRIEGTLGRGTPEGEPITADEIRRARLRTRRGGYHELAVDFALQAFIVAIEALPAGAGGHPAFPAPRTARTEPDPEVRRRGAHRPLRAARTEPERGDREDQGERADYAAQVERVAFRSGRLGMGYDEDEVDAFLDRAVATLRGTADTTLTSDGVREARFTTVMLRPGYAIGEVDEFLADLAEVLESRVGR